MTLSVETLEDNRRARQPASEEAAAGGDGHTTRLLTWYNGYARNRERRVWHDGPSSEPAMTPRSDVVGSLLRPEALRRARQGARRTNQDLNVWPRWFHRTLRTL